MRYREPKNNWDVGFAEDYLKNLQDIDAEFTSIVSRIANLILAASSGEIQANDARLDLLNILHGTLKDRLDSDAMKVLSKADLTYVETMLAAAVSGAPKGVYTTLNALKTAYPQGTEGVFLVLENGHIYIWNATVWTDAGAYQGVEVGDRTITPLKTNFLELDKTLNLYDGNPVKKTLTGGATGGYTLENLSAGRVAKVTVKPNTTYTVIRQASSRFKIGSDTVADRTSGTLNGGVYLFYTGDSNVYVSTFKTGPNDVVLYVDYSNASESILVQIVEGTQTGFTITDYPYKPTGKLSVYTKKEVDDKQKNISIAPSNTTFLEKVNLYDGNYIRKTLTGAATDPSYTLDSNSTGRVAKVLIAPNTTYTVIRQASSRFKIATDTVMDRASGEALNGGVKIFNTGASNVYVCTFTTGPNDVVLYVDYSSTNENVYVEVLKGTQTDFIANSYSAYNPTPDLNVYSKASVYTKKEVDDKQKNISIAPSNAAFLERANLYDGNYVRKTLSGSVNSYTLDDSSTGRVAKIPIAPNTKYSVIRPVTSRFKIATDTIMNRATNAAGGGILNGAVSIFNLGTSSVYYATFTTGPNDVVLYVDYSSTDEDVYIEVVKGTQTDFVVKSYNSFNPKPELNIYSKAEVKSLIQTTSPTNPAKQPLRVLLIGNSFSVDATEVLFKIIEKMGLNVTIGVAYDSGQSLEGHYNKILNNQTITSYNKWTLKDGYVSTPNALVSNIVVDEEWDIITYQQVSSKSFDYSTYQPHLTNLHNYVKGKAKNANVKYGMQLTWTYPKGSDNLANAGYTDQMKMYEDIVNAYQQAMFDMKFELLIPSGTAVQNARGNKYLQAVGSDLTRDNLHMDLGIGRYITGLTTFEALLAGYYGKDIMTDVEFYPIDNQFLGYLAKKVAKNAVLNPFNVTKV